MKAAQFQLDAETKAFDLEHRRKIRFNIGKYDAAVALGMNHFQDHELARDRGAYLKAQVLASAASGATAAVAINTDLITEDTDRAVSARKSLLPR